MGCFKVTQKGVIILGAVAIYLFDSILLPEVFVKVQLPLLPEQTDISGEREFYFGVLLEELFPGVIS